MTGYIDVGGGLRAVYGTGVLDFCLDRKIDFPYLIGVSAGSGNIISYLARQKGRSLKFYTDFAFRKEYMSFHNFLKSGSYIDLDYIYSYLSNEAESGNPAYFTKSDVAKNSYDVFKTSSCIPVVNKAYPFGGKIYYDGGLSDPIPIKKAFSDGCDKVVICLTRPLNYRKKRRLTQKMCDRALSEYPETAKTLFMSADKYNEDIEYIQKLQEEGKVLIIAPRTCFGVETLSRKRKSIEQLYELGYNDAEKFIGFLEG